jgi:hypothetical protein
VIVIDDDGDDCDLNDDKNSDGVDDYDFSNDSKWLK